MGLFENITTINASENYLTLGSLSQLKLIEDSISINSQYYIIVVKESFKCFANLKCLSLNCNGIKSIRLKHGEFDCLENLDLSFNSLVPTDISHLGILKNLKVLKLTGNNLTYLPDTFSKQYVYTHELVFLYDINLNTLKINDRYSYYNLKQ